MHTSSNGARGVSRTDHEITENVQEKLNQLFSSNPKQLKETRKHRDVLKAEMTLRVVTQPRFTHLQRDWRQVITTMADVKTFARGYFLEYNTDLIEVCSSNIYETGMLLAKPCPDSTRNDFGAELERSHTTGEVDACRGFP